MIIPGKTKTVKCKCSTYLPSLSFIHSRRRDQNQSTGQQRNQVDGFDDNFEGGMHDFDQGIDNELNNAARQKSQEGV